MENNTKVSLAILSFMNCYRNSMRKAGIPENSNAERMIYGILVDAADEWSKRQSIKQEGIELIKMAREQRDK